MNPFQFRAPTVAFANKSAVHLQEFADGILGDKVLFVTDEGLRRLGLCDAPLTSLATAGTTVTIFSEVEADPSLQTLLRAVERGQSAGVTGVVGFGGGSSLDVAKLAALLLGSGEDIGNAWGVGKAKGPRLPLVLVPTTAGTGSEVTPVSIITVGEGEKRGVSSPIILPDVAVLDPELTVGLPSAITAATGVDAMVHAIEAYTSQNANNNPISRTLAREALRILGANIERAVFHGADIKARSAMLLGSMLAGQAFANSPVAAVHALAYPVGGTFHVPHGLSNALVLPHVLRFNAPEAANLYAEIAADAFPELEAEPSIQSKCVAFIDALASLSSRLGMSTKLRDVGVGEQHLSQMAKDAMKQQRLLVNNPRALTESDALAIYRAAW
jgi:alcohol dehydrogenase class IV